MLLEYSLLASYINILNLFSDWSCVFEITRHALPFGFFGWTAFSCVSASSCSLFLTARRQCWPTLLYNLTANLPNCFLAFLWLSLICISLLFRALWWVMYWIFFCVTTLLNRIVIRLRVVGWLWFINNKLQQRRSRGQFSAVPELPRKDLEKQKTLCRDNRSYRLTLERRRAKLAAGEILLDQLP